MKIHNSVNVTFIEIYDHSILKLFLLVISHPLNNIFYECFY